MMHAYGAAAAGTRGLRAKRVSTAESASERLGDRRVRKGGGVAARARALPGDGGVRRRAEHGDVHRRDQRVRRGHAARQGDDALHVHGGGGRAAQLGDVRGGDQRVHAQRAVGARPPPLRGNGCKGRGRRHGAASRDAQTAASRTVSTCRSPLCSKTRRTTVVFPSDSALSPVQTSACDAFTKLRAAETDEEREELRRRDDRQHKLHLADFVFR